MTSRLLRLALVSMMVVCAAGCHGIQPNTPSQTVIAPASTTPAPFTVTIHAAENPLQVDMSTAIVVEVVRDGQAAPNGTVVIFSSTGGVVTPQSAATTNGQVQATFRAAVTANHGTVTVSVGGRNTSSAMEVVGSIPTNDPAPPESKDPGPISVTVTGTNVTLGGSSSFSASAKNAAGAQFTWNYGDGATSSSGGSNTTAHQYAALGSYTTQVTVTDRDGRTANGSVTTTVSPVPPAPPPPVPTPFYGVALSASPSSVVVGDSSTLTATATAFNGAPAPTTYTWDCDGDNTYESNTGAVNSKACTYSAAGTITSRVRVSGGTATGSGSTDVTVAAAAPLVVGIVPSTSTPTVGVAMTFTATVTSTGPVPATLRWEWDDEGDGTYEVVIPSAASPNVRTTSYGSVGVKTIKIRVTDPATGRVTMGSRMVTVS